MHPRDSSPPDLDRTISELFHAEHAQLVARLTARLQVDRTLVDDAVQFAFIKYAEGKCPDEMPAAGWLYTVARRDALHRFAAECQTHSLECLPEPQSPDSLEARAEARAVLQGLGQLSSNQRRALRLQAAGYSYTEIADLTGRTYTWVNRHIREGRAALRAARDL